MAESIPLLVLGARQYAPVFADVFEGMSGFRIEAFVENLDRNLCRTRILDLPVLWIDEIDALNASHHAICCLATSHRADFIAQAEAKGFRFATLIHPSASVSRRSTIGEGTSLDVSVIVAGFSSIGRHVRVGRGATIGHHTRIEDYATLHPAANVAGNCVIGPRATIGIGATVIDGRTIGEGAFIAAGSAVTADIPAFALAAGVPARVIRENYGPK